MALLSISQRKVANALVEYFRTVGQPNSVFSPMNQRIISEMADMIEMNSMPWLLEASETRTPLETSLLLPAGIHRQVLLNSAETTELRKYYPSVGGIPPSQEDQNFHGVLRETMEALKDELMDTIRNDTIQTNETGRGMVWLYPTLLTGWDTVDHLVDLGASAGLNLVADHRRYTFHTDDSSCGFGRPTTDQFSVRCSRVPGLLSNTTTYPTILARSGCDLNPFPLQTEEDRARLQSYVWPDQLERLERLQEGIAAHQDVTETTQKIDLHAVSLPHGLPDFLQTIMPPKSSSLSSSSTTQDEKVVIYNTYMTEYLENQGRDLRAYIHDWANETKKTVLWTQSEPPREEPELSQMPREHWCLWTVDLWEPHDGHKRWKLAWVHPHLKEVDWFEEELHDFVSYVRD